MRRALLLTLLLAAGLAGCSDSRAPSSSGTETANNPLPPINGSEGDAFAPNVPSTGFHPVGDAPPPMLSYATGSPGHGDLPPPSPVPEPSTLLLVGSGLAGLWMHRRRRRARDLDA